MGNGSPEASSALLRCGARDSGCVDNTSVGGVAIGIDLEAGQLETKGTSKARVGGACSGIITHPSRTRLPCPLWVLHVTISTM